jgi:hypothetical protein
MQLYNVEIAKNGFDMVPQWRNIHTLHVKCHPEKELGERKRERGGVIKNNNVIKITVNLPQA